MRYLKTPVLTVCHYFSAAAKPSLIPIVTRNPAYRTENAIFLSGLDLPIAVVSELYEYLSNTPSTLLIRLYPHYYVPIWAIAADITFPTGPAAIICTKVFSYLWHK